MNLKEIHEKAVYQAVWQLNDLHALQSWDWGVVKEQEGWKLIRLLSFREVETKEMPEDVLQMQVKPLPIIGGSFGYIPKLNPDKWTETNALKALLKYLKTRKIAFAIMEFDGDPANKFSVPDNPLLEIYAGHIQPSQTDLVPLSRSEDELFMQLDGKYRRNIKKAIREGLSTRLYQYGAGSDQVGPVTAFYGVMQSIFQNTKFMERDKAYFQSLWNSMGHSGRARIFTAVKKDEASGQEQTVGAYLVVSDNKRAYELYGGVTRTGRDYEAGYLLKWEAIRYFNSLGLSYYDHWGVAPKLETGSYDNTDELFQISKFKAGFGGEYFQFPEARVLVADSFKYRLFLAGIKSNKLITKLKKAFK